MKIGRHPFKLFFKKKESAEHLDQLDMIDEFERAVIQSNQVIPSEESMIKLFFKSRFAVILGILFLCMSLFLGQLVYLQIFAAEDYRLAQGFERRQQLSITPPRGEILDRYGNKLATNKKINNLYLAYAGLDTIQLNQVLADLAILLDQYNIPYATELDQYLDLKTMTYARPAQEILNWQMDKNFLGLKALPNGTSESAKDTQFVKPTPSVFYEYMRKIRFEISDQYPTDVQHKIFALRFAIYLQNWFFEQGTPVLIAKNVPESICHFVEEQNYKYIGAFGESSYTRVYSDVAPYLSHALGYVGQINSEEYKEWGGQGYSYSDTVGKAGIERVAERYLHGQNGVKPYYIWSNQASEKKEINALGIPSKAGYQVELTIDPTLQKVAMDSMERYAKQRIESAEVPEGYKNRVSGATVVMNLKDGGSILAMASYPYYDPRVL